MSFPTDCIAEVAVSIGFNWSDAPEPPATDWVPYLPEDPEDPEEARETKAARPAPAVHQEGEPSKAEQSIRHHSVAQVTPRARIVAENEDKHTISTDKTTSSDRQTTSPRPATSFAQLRADVDLAPLALLQLHEGEVHGVLVHERLEKVAEVPGPARDRRGFSRTP